MVGQLLINNVTRIHYLILVTPVGHGDEGQCHIQVWNITVTAVASTSSVYIPLPAVGLAY